MLILSVEQVKRDLRLCAPHCEMLLLLATQHKYSDLKFVSFKSLPFMKFVGLTYEVLATLNAGTLGTLHGSMDTTWEHGSITQSTSKAQWESGLPPSHSAVDTFPIIIWLHVVTLCDADHCTRPYSETFPSLVECSLQARYCILIPIV